MSKVTLSYITLEEGNAVQVSPKTIGFSSPNVTVEGSIGVHPSPRTLEFSSPTPTITGYETIVPVSPKTMEFAGAAEVKQYSGIVDISPKTIGFSGDASVYVMDRVSLAPKTIGFSSPTPEITGYHTIITVPPRTLGFSDPGIGVALADVPTTKSGSYVLPSPKTMGFSSNAGIATDNVSVLDGNVTITSNPKTVGFSDPGVSAEEITAVWVSPQTIEFSDPGIEVEGYKTIITVPPKTMEFDGTAEVKQYSGIVDISPKTIEFSGDAEIIQGTWIDVSPRTIEFTAPAPAISGFAIVSSETLTLFKSYLAGTELPITSFQITLYADKNAYMEMVVPGFDYVDEIVSNSDGNLSLYMAYASIGTLEVLQENLLVSVELDAPKIDKGVKNKSITLSGHETDAQAARRQSSPREITLGDDWYNYRRTDGTDVTARMVKPNIYLQAGDTITDDDGSFVVDRITWMKSESVHHMEITGVAA